MYLFQIMDYQTYQPSSDLSPFVKCFWTLDAPTEENPAIQTIVPDGCMEMIFHYGDPYHQILEDKDPIIQPRCFVFGQLTRPLKIQPTAVTGIFSVRFHPEGFSPFATIPIKEMTDRAVPLEELYGSAIQSTMEAMVQESPTEQRIQAITTFLRKRLVDTATIDRIISETVQTLLTANGHIPVGELARQNDLNPRKLQRSFAEAIGLSPKQLAKTIRLQAALKMLINQEHDRLTDLAYDGEFYDQAHFIKDFKAFTGRTPKTFYGDQLTMSQLFYGEE